MINSAIRRTALLAGVVSSLTIPAAGRVDSRRMVLAELMTSAGAVELPQASTAIAGAPQDDSSVSAKDEARFDWLMKRHLERTGLPPEASDTPDQSKWGPYPAPWKELEKARAAQFDRRFGQGTYDAMTRFSDDCRNANGCERLLTADLISGAYRFIDLEKDVDSGAVVRGSEAYRSRDEKLKTEMRAAVEAFRPKAGARKAYTKAFAAFADPILDEISVKP